MKVTSIEPGAIAEPGGRLYVVLKVSTDQGISGYGEAPVDSGAEVTVERIKRKLAGEVGSNPDRTLLADRRLQRASVTPGARAALCMALLDIAGKAAKSPLYEFLGGPTRNKARAMAVIAPESAEQMQAAVLAAKAVGRRAFSIPLEMSEVRGRSFYVDIRSMMDSLRTAAGSSCDFVLDCAGKTTTSEEASIADRMEDSFALAGAATGATRLSAD